MFDELFPSGYEFKRVPRVSLKRREGTEVLYGGVDSVKVSDLEISGQYIPPDTYDLYSVHEKYYS